MTPNEALAALAAPAPVSVAPKGEPIAVRLSIKRNNPGEPDALFALTGKTDAMKARVPAPEEEHAIIGDVEVIDRMDALTAYYRLLGIVSVEKHAEAELVYAS